MSSVGTGKLSTQQRDKQSLAMGVKVASKSCGFPQKSLAALLAPKQPLRKAGLSSPSRYYSDRYEQQARNVAKSWFANNDNVKQQTPTSAPLSRGILSATPADYHLPTSPGKPLPEQCRLSLEQDFNADFSVVRIHTDAHAKRAARAEGARAFAAGAHIYFAEGTYQPTTMAGQELLVHELTHVLQQTGRSSMDGKLRATEVAGEGEIQHFDFLGEADRYKVFNTLTWSEIKAAYKTVADFKTHEKILDAIVPLTLPASEQQDKDIDAQVNKKSFSSLSKELKGFYIDALKYMLHYKQAWKVLKKDLEIPTVFRDRQFYEYIRKQPLSWLPKVAKKNDYAAFYYPWRLVNAYHRFLLSPDGRPTDLGLPPETEEEKKAKAAKKAAAKSKGEAEEEKKFGDALLSHLWSIRSASKAALMDNELHPIMLLAFYYLDSGRKREMPKELKKKRKKGGSRVAAVMKLSQDYAKGDVDTLVPTSVEESKALFSGVLPSIKKKAAEAATFWQQSTAFKSAHLNGKDFKKLSKEEVKRIANGIKTDKKLSKFSKTITKTAKNVFAKKGGKLPSAEKFAATVKARKSALVNLMASYVGKISALLQRGESGSEQALRYGLAMVYLADIEAVLDAYSATRDKKLAAHNFDDERKALRIRLADEVIEIALLFGWNDLRLLANAVFLEGYQLAIPGGWKEDKTTKFGDMGKQLKSVVLHGYEGTKISAALLENFLYGNYFESLVQVLKKLLTARADDFADKKPILNIAFRNANAGMSKPRRFLARDWEYTNPGFARHSSGKKIKPSSKATKTPPNLGDLIFASEVTKKTIDEQKTFDELALAPTKFFSPSKPLYLWFVPEFPQFIEFLSTLKPVTDALKDFSAAKTAAAKALPNPQDDPWGWLEVFDKTIEALQKSKDPKDVKALKAIGDAIFGGVTGKTDDAEKEAHKRAREAVTHQRRVLIDNYLKPTLTTFDRHDRTQWHVPREIFDSIEKFAKFVWPDKDELLQVTTLVLEIANELNAAFGPKESLLGTSHIRRFMIMDTLLTLIWGTLDHWNKRQKEAAKAATPSVPALFLNPIVSISTLPYTTLLMRVSTLKALKKSIQKRVVAEQKRRGITTKKGTQKDDGSREGGEVSSIYWENEGWTLIKWSMESGTSIKENQGFKLYGDVYVVSAVHENFQFHPGFGKRETLGINWPSKQRPGDPLLYVDGTQVTKPTGRKLITILFSPAKGKGQERIITDKDLDQLLWFSNVLSGHFSFEYIKGAGVLIETIATAELEIAELLILKGGGKAAKVAIVLAEIARFMASTDFNQIKKTIFQNPQLVKDHFISLLANGAPGLVEKLLFGDLPFESQLVAPDIESQKGKKKKTTGKLGKFLKFVTERSEDALRAFVRLRGRVRGSFVQAQSNIISRPQLLRLVEAVPLLIQLVNKFPESVDIAEALDLGDPKKVQAKLKAQIQDIANSMVELEIPQDIIPMDLAVEVLLEFSLGRLGAKGKALRELADAIRADTLVAKQIANALNAGGLNPNLYWRTEVVEKIQPLLGKAQLELYNSVKDLVATATKNAIQLDKPKLKKSALNIDKSKPQLELYRDPTAAQEDYPHQTDTVDISDGTPLSKTLSQRFVAEFGHNFDHVRLHGGKSAQQLTRAAGAHALTSGSHIFLNRGVNPDDSRGRKILRHELAHVLQQVGSRPRLLEHSKQPVLGSPGKGLSFDKEREAAADRMAGRAESGAEEEPLAIEVAGGQGLLPSVDMNAIAVKLLDQLTEEDVALNQAEAFEKPVPGKVARKATFVSAKTKGDIMWKSITDIVSKKAANAVFSAPLNKAKDEVATLLSGSFNTKINTVISGIVLRSIQTLANGRIKFKAKLFANNLETYIFARTGLVVNISVNTSTNKAKKVKIKYLHLAFLHGGTGLWGAMKANTTVKLTAAQQKVFDKNAWRRVRHIIEARLHEKPVWHKTEFRLGKQFIEEVTELLKTTKEVKIDTWKQYKNPKEIKSATAGLRVATHGELTGKAKRPVYTNAKNMPDSARKDRQSHHIPQYLLIEYFRGNNSTPLFANAGEHLPGFMPSGKQKALDGFSTSGSSSSLSIDFANYDPTSGRGDKLPAISLAAITHQKGRLHINAASSWKLANETKGTQGKQIDTLFLKHLHEKTKVTGSKAEIKKKTASMTAAQLTDFRNNTYSAMKETYSAMYNYMIKTLPTALVDYEIPYYKDIAMALKNVDSDDDLPGPFKPAESAASIKDAKAAMEAKNKTVMTDWR